MSALAIGVIVVASLLMRQTKGHILAVQRFEHLNQTARAAAVLSRRVIDLERSLLTAASRLDRSLDAVDRLDCYFETNAVLPQTYIFMYFVDAKRRHRTYFQNEQ